LIAPSFFFWKISQPRDASSRGRRRVAGIFGAKGAGLISDQWQEVIDPAFDVKLRPKVWSSLLHGFAEIAKSPVVALGSQEMADSDDGGDRPLDDPHHRQRGQSSEIDQQVTRGKINGSQDRKLQPAAIAEGRRRTVVIRPSR
jgi:hypothetical protein